MTEINAPNRAPDGIVQRLRCKACGATSVNFVIVGDTDMVTDGLIAATVCGEDAVIVAKARPAEWSESATGKIKH